MSDAILQGGKVSRYFGGIKAVEGVDFAVERGSITSLIGPNGAGKTTLFNVITGIFPATKGEVDFQAQAGRTQSLNGYRVDEITAFGIARTFQNIRLFGELTALENVKLGQHAPTEQKRPLDVALHKIDDARKAIGNRINLYPVLCAIIAFVYAQGDDGLSLAALIVSWVLLILAPMTVVSAAIAILGLIEAGRATGASLLRLDTEEAEITNASLGYLKFVGLLDKADEVASSLAYGDQRRLEIARALASQPQLLLLDEPAAGMNPNETEDLMALIGKIRGAGITVLLIEHDMKLVMNISDTIYVLDHGERIAHGTPQEVGSDPRVIQAYLGVTE